MEQMLEQAKMILDLLSHVVFGICVTATAIVRLTPTKSDDRKMAQILKKVHHVFAYLPTLGINPKTKELEELHDKVEQKDEVSKS
jgi:hypothetical protein